MAQELKNEYDLVTQCAIGATLSHAIYTFDKVWIIRDETPYGLVFCVSLTLIYLAICVHYWSTRHTTYVMALVHSITMAIFLVFTALFGKLQYGATLLVLPVTSVAVLSAINLSFLCKRMRELK